MIDKISSYVKKYHMIAEGDTIIAGISGGADSVCLLLVLCELQKSLPFVIRAVHIEHGIRGEASRADEQFVQALCDKLGIPLVCYHYDVPKLAKEWGNSLEEAGRKLRYETFAREAESAARAKEVEKSATAIQAILAKQVKIAVAHHENDNAETVLHHLVRGSALQGLAGIAPVRGNLIRPLLCVTREEIEEFLKQRGQSYCIDATNYELEYTRNRIRHEVLPVLTQINGQAVSHMAYSAEVLRETQEYMQMQSKRLEETAVTKTEEGLLVNREEVWKEPVILRRLLLHRQICELAGSSRDIAASHVNAVLELFDRQVGRSINLPYGICAKRVYEGVYFTETKEKTAGEKPFWGQAAPLPKCDSFRCRIFENNERREEIPKKKYTKWFDYDKIKDNLCVRNRQKGDYFWLNEGGDRKKLKQYFVDEKIPQDMRNTILLVAEGEHIVWVVGYRISAKYKVTENTERVLEIQYDGGRTENE